MLEEIEELKLEQGIHVERFYRAEETQCRTEEERKAMESRLAKAVEDRSFSKELLFAEKERSNDLAKELCFLQEQRRTIESH